MSLVLWVAELSSTRCTSRSGGRLASISSRKLAELDRAVAWEALADHLAGGHIERGKQAGGAVSNIVVGAPLGLARPQRQERLSAVERLHLALFVDAQHDGVVGWGEVQTDDIAHFLGEQRIGGELEGLRA